MPVPISQSPSRRDRGAGSRSAQPKRSAPSCRHSRSPSLDHGLPVAGSTSAWLRSRSSTGSRPSSCASSSIARLEREHAERLAGPAGERRRHRVAADQPVRRPRSSRSRTAATTPGRRLGPVVERRRDRELVDAGSRSAGRRASRRATMRCSCSSRWPYEVNICPRVTASLTGRRTCARGHRGERHVRPHHRLAAEAAADELGEDAHVRQRQAEQLRDTSAASRVTPIVES